ncbi:dATP/dGTP diphosphohydrolase domain-containing protein [Methylorubrum zatmanii]
MSSTDDAYAQLAARARDPEPADGQKVQPERRHGIPIRPDHLRAPSAMPHEQTDAPTAGSKHDAGKEPVGLIPREAVLAEARVLAFGAEKYAAHNWRKGMRWSRLGDAAMRHLLAWLDGEDNDPETGLPHLAHLRCCAGFLLAYAERGDGTDDRHTAGGQA